MKIGVFDSGVGGLSVATAIQTAFPAETIMFVYDAEHFPYGNRPPQELLGFVVPILERMVAAGCQVIVIACNTVSTTLIHELRAAVPVPLIAIEPMVKPAAGQTKSGVIAVCATDATKASARYANLKQLYAQGLTVLEPDCSDWARMIETKQLDHQKIRDQIDEVCRRGADVIVLGCTHYHWIEQEIQAMAKGRAVVIQPEAAIISRLHTVIGEITAKAPDTGLL